MNSELIFKENELIDPDDYSEEQRALVDEFNRRIRRCMGIITGLGKEYHTIWLINSKDMTMRLYRSTGENTARGAVELGLKYNNYNRMISEYVDNYVVDRNENVLKKVEHSYVLSRIKDGELYTVDYMRMDDDGNMSYHQMAFALAGQWGETDDFILAYRDIDKSIRKHISDKRYLREQLDIVQALSRDYYNVFKVDLKSGTVVILKLDGYVTKGMEGAGEKIYPYEVLCKQYIKDRVYVEDQPAMYEAMDIETVRAKMLESDEYVSSYRVMDNGSVHYYQFTYIPINPRNPDAGILAGFKNVDDVVESAKERETLELLANTDMMMGILNRGSGERKVTEAITGGKKGMFCITDIDNFKAINDNHGHDVGDKVIREIASIFKNEFRDSDIVFRLGGDECAVFAYNVCDEAAANAIINRIFDKIKVIDIPELASDPVTISVGSVLISRDEPYEFDDVYKKADICVYESKKKDGNALTFYRD